MRRAVILVTWGPSRVGDWVNRWTRPKTKSLIFFFSFSSNPPRLLSLLLSLTRPLCCRAVRSLHTTIRRNAHDQTKSNRKSDTEEQIGTDRSVSAFEDERRRRRRRSRRADGWTDGLADGWGEGDEANVAAEIPTNNRTEPKWKATRWEEEEEEEGGWRRKRNGIEKENKTKSEERISFSLSYSRHPSW